MTTGNPTARQIERWIPESILDFVANQNLKSHFKGLIEIGDLGSNLMILGPSSTGKTAMVKAFIRSLCCLSRDPQTLRPCGACASCRSLDVRFAEAGLFAECAAQGRDPIHYFPINCGTVTEGAVKELVQTVYACKGPKLIYLDEVHRLAKRSLDEGLLVPLREVDAVTYASSTTMKGLEEAFHGRFTCKKRTSLPNHEDLTVFLRRRCEDWGITYDAGTLETVSCRSRLVTGHALGVLAEAASSPRRHIDTDLAASYVFYFDEL